MSAARDASDTLVTALQRQLDDIATADKKDWLERYLRQEISFRGVGMSDIRGAVADWRTEHEIDGWSTPRQFTLALRLFEEPMAEDKLAGIVFLREYLLGELTWQSAVEGYESVFERGLVYDWNTCDWFCVRVLGPTIDSGGVRCARRVAGWRSADNLWQARASAVAFVNLTAEARFHADLTRACRQLISRDERFAKTGVGWVLHELWKTDTKAVRGFVDDNLEHFSFESLRNALKYAPTSVRDRYVAQLKSL